MKISLPKARYHLVSTWHLTQIPPTAVWQAIAKPEEWPSWWPSMEQISVLHDKRTDGLVGSQFAVICRPYQLYALRFTITLTEVNPPRSIVGTASGDLEGTGMWQFTQQQNVIILTLTWDVSTTNPWMNLISPLMRPIFSFVHRLVMNQGERGLQKLLSQ